VQCAFRMLEEVELNLHRNGILDVVLEERNSRCQASDLRLLFKVVGSQTEIG